MTAAPPPLIAQEEINAIYREAREEAAVVAESVMGSPWHATTARECARRIRALGNVACHSQDTSR